MLTVRTLNFYHVHKKKYYPLDTPFQPSCPTLFQNIPLTLLYLRLSPSKIAALRRSLFQLDPISSSKCYVLPLRYSFIKGSCSAPFLQATCLQIPNPWQPCLHVISNFGGQFIPLKFLKLVEPRCPEKIWSIFAVPVRSRFPQDSQPSFWKFSVFPSFP